MANPVRKPFEKELYDKFDNPAKEALVKILEAKGHEIQNVSENFYADVVSTFEGETYFSEAEVKRAWKADWPTSWEEIRIPERKKRLIKKYKGNVTFYVFNHNTTQCWEIHGKELTEDHLKKAFGKNIRAGEMFYHYPYQEATLLKV